MADSSRIKLEPSWKARVGDYLLRPEMRALSTFLRERAAAGARIFPPARNIFAAFDATPFEQVKVVILGQDPYHGPGQAHGRSEEHTSELQSRENLVCRLLLEKKKTHYN